jgi:hypothetical protein
MHEGEASTRIVRMTGVSMPMRTYLPFSPDFANARALPNTLGGRLTTNPAGNGWFLARVDIWRRQYPDAGLVAPTRMGPRSIRRREDCAARWFGQRCDPQVWFKKLGLSRPLPERCISSLAQPNLPTEG